MGVLECSNGIFVGQRHAGSRGYGCGTVMDVKCGHHAENYAQRGDGPSSQTRAKPLNQHAMPARLVYIVFVDSYSVRSRLYLVSR